MKKIISMLLAMTLMVTLLPCTAFAAANDDKGTGTNPEYISSVSEAGEILREGMKIRKDTITIYYEVSQEKTFNQSLIKSLSKDIYDEAVKHTGNPKEGDYLAFTTGGYKVSAAAMASGSVYKVTLNFYMDNYNNTAQEKKLDQQIDKVKKQLAIDGKPVHEQIKAIHDYMKKHIDYDYDGKADASNKLCHTAYAALINGKSVCQGYSTLFYRLALEYGIDTRIISGQSKGENHSWNIVKMGDVYYNIDVTWDTTTKSEKYLLKSETDFVSHTRDAEYTTAAFKKAYPMAKTSYSIKCSGHVGETVTTRATPTKDGSVVTSCKHCGAVMSRKTIRKASNIKLSFASNKDNGKVKNPKVVVKDSAGKTIKAANYQVYIPGGRKNVGTYTYVVNFVGTEYSGSKKLNLIINPKDTSVSSAKGAKKAFTVKWKKVTGQADGYQVQYATNKTFTKGKKMVKVKGIKSTSKKISKLTAKKTYYVRVRTYKKVSGKTYYSTWSKAKTVKTK